MQKTFYSLTRCVTGPLSFDLQLPKTGFVPGEKIPINAECVNKSNLNVDNVTITLRQVNNFQPINSCTAVETIVLAEKHTGSVAPFETKTLFTELEIPSSILPLSTVHSKFVFIHYELFVSSN